MADNKRKRGKQDRAKVSLYEVWEVAYLAKVFGITRDTVRRVVKSYPGRSRKQIVRALMTLTSERNAP